MDTENSDLAPVPTVPLLAQWRPPANKSAENSAD